MRGDERPSRASIVYISILFSLLVVPLLVLRTVLVGQVANEATDDVDTDEDERGPPEVTDGSGFVVQVGNLCGRDRYVGVPRVVLGGVQASLEGRGLAVEVTDLGNAAEDADASGNGKHEECYQPGVGVKGSVPGHGVKPLLDFVLCSC